MITMLQLFALANLAAIAYQFHRIRRRSHQQQARDAFWTQQAKECGE